MLVAKSVLPNPIITVRSCLLFILSKQSHVETCVNMNLRFVIA